MFVSHEGPDQTWPIVSSILSHDGHFGLAGRKLACEGEGGVVRAPFPDPPPLLGSCDGDPRRAHGDPQRADRGGWGRFWRYHNIYDSKCSPRCADHFEVCITGEIFFEKKIFRAALRRSW